MSHEGGRPGDQSVEGTEDTERNRPQDPAEGAEDTDAGEAQAHSQEPAEGADDAAETGAG